MRQKTAEIMPKYCCNFGD